MPSKSDQTAIDYSCIDDVPLQWVRGNQLGILISIIASLIIQQPWVLFIPLLVQLISRIYGIRYNPFVRLLAPIFPKSTKTESRELLRFNNLLAILFLVVTLLSFSLGATIVAYVFLAMLTAAVTVALCGFCIGCFMYFQWKQFRARSR